jgi:rhodanese-related sulfurtransferase
MIKKSYFLLIILLSSLFLVSCEKDEPAVINESEVLATYLESTSSPLQKDFVNSDMPTIMSAEEVKTLNAAGQVYIMDIRAAADFTTGHIPNAHNVALGDILTHIEGIDLAPYTKVAIVCYTGQTAGFATTLLRLMGYDKAFSMKWGMCSWNSDFAGKWNAAIANGNAYATQFTSTETVKPAKGEMPVLTTGKTTGEEIFKARVAAVLAEGFTPAAVTAATLFGGLDTYYIINYWPAAQYADPGHIPGAVQYTPKESIKLATDLKTLPTDKPIAVYCYTGQTSAFLTAYLRLLGYDAKSLLYGTNDLIYDIMVNKQMTVFNASQIKGYAYE